MPTGSLVRRGSSHRASAASDPAARIPLLPGTPLALALGSKARRGSGQGHVSTERDDVRVRQVLAHQLEGAAGSCYPHSSLHPLMLLLCAVSPDRPVVATLGEFNGGPCGIPDGVYDAAARPNDAGVGAGVEIKV